jgi:hypothetical protein
MPARLLPLFLAAAAKIEERSLAVAGLLLSFYLPLRWGSRDHRRGAGF